MHTDHDIKKQALADAWATLHAHANNGEALRKDSYRFAFADPEFLMRNETRGVRLQLEMAKPDLIQQALGIDHTIVVFGSARFKDQATADALKQGAQASGDVAAQAVAERLQRNARYYEAARSFAYTVAQHSQAQAPENRLFICTGGGPGIMEAANRGASEAGAPTVGLNIAQPHEQSANPYVSSELNFKFHYFALRKMHFMMRAKALLAFPGGFGTLDELFEVITLVQCKKVKAVPIVLFGTDYWKRLINLDVLLEEGTISADDLELITYVDTPEDAWNAIKRFYNLT
jgi:uncharacterized protein (TIGR00730 family)